MPAKSAPHAREWAAICGDSGSDPATTIKSAPGWRKLADAADLRSAALRGIVGSNPTPGIPTTERPALPAMRGHPGRSRWLRALAQPLRHRAHLVVEGLLPVAALVELEHGVDPGQPELERDAVELGDDGEDVLGRALELRPHRLQPVADLVLGGEPPLDLGDVLARARVRAPQPDHGELG